ncbi:hypothetical protein C8R44DRAFT_796466, partial [Mycena epipterygia]
HSLHGKCRGVLWPILHPHLPIAIGLHAGLSPLLSPTTMFCVWSAPYASASSTR